MLENLKSRFQDAVRFNSSVRAWAAGIVLFQYLAALPKVNTPFLIALFQPYLNSSLQKYLPFSK